MLFTAATFLSFTAVSVLAAPALELSLSGSNSVTDVDNFSVVTTLTNTGDETLELFNDPRGVLSSFPESTFSVVDTRFRRQASFIGAKVKYSFEHATSFTTLAPGQSVEVYHDLSVGYNFTTTGQYDVDVNNRLFYKDAQGQAVEIYAAVPSVLTTNLSGSLVSSRLAERGLHKRATFVSCSSTRQSQINTAITSAKSYLSNALSYLNSASSSSLRYRTWFGTYSSSNDNLVTSHFQKIQTSDIATYTYNCGCTDDYYAYVYPNNFGYVYLCNAFWSAPTTGTDSKAGTIVHEAAHFTRNGGTQDYAYGQSRAKSLATSNPSRAVMNSDNHEYFVENTPFQN